MNKKTLLITGVALFTLVGFVAWSAFVVYFFKTQYAPASTARVEDYQIRFGIIETDSSGKTVVSKETTTLPLKLKETGFRFGLEIKPPNNQSYRTYCVFHFSQPPKIVSGFTSDEASTTMKEDEELVRGTIVEDHWFDPGDPVGPQSIDVYINGKLAKTIKYTVTDDNP